MTLHVQNATAWAETVQWRLVAGDSLLFDFIYFSHPTAIGHWCAGAPAALLPARMA